MVRAERASDREAVRRVHVEAFGDHGPAVAALADALRERSPSEALLSLVATDQTRVVGHVMFTPAVLDAPRELVQVQVLSPVGVLPEWQRTGVGTSLINRGIELLADRGVPLVFLEGSPDYYPRLGFVTAVDHGFRTPSLRIPAAAFQVRILPAYQPWMTGTLIYSQTFWDHDAVGLRE